MVHQAVLRELTKRSFSTTCWAARRTTDKMARRGAYSIHQISKNGPTTANKSDVKPLDANCSRPTRSFSTTCWSRRPLLDPQVTPEKLQRSTNEIPKSLHSLNDPASSRHSPRPHSPSPSPAKSHWSSELNSNVSFFCQLLMLKLLRSMLHQISYSSHLLCKLMRQIDLNLTKKCQCAPLAGHLCTAQGSILLVGVHHVSWIVQLTWNHNTSLFQDYCNYFASSSCWPPIMACPLLKILN